MHPVPFSAGFGGWIQLQSLQPDVCWFLLKHLHWRCCFSQGHVGDEGSVTETSHLMASLHVRGWKVLLTSMRCSRGGQFQLRNHGILLKSPNLEGESMARTGERQERFAIAVEQAEGFLDRRKFLLILGLDLMRLLK